MSSGGGDAARRTGRGAGGERQVTSAPGEISGQPALIGRSWRTRRSAAVAGILFGVLLITALVMLRTAGSGDQLADLASDPGRRRVFRIGLGLVPFAGIAFLWFIGVVRDQVGAAEDRLFSTVFLGSGFLFLACLFLGAVVATGLEVLATRAQTSGAGDTLAVWVMGRESVRVLVSVYAMRMAAVFTLSVSTLVLRTRAVPRWIAYLGYAEALCLLVLAEGNQWIQLAFPVWVLVLSVTILALPARATAATTGAGSDAATPGPPG